MQPRTTQSGSSVERLLIPALAEATGRHERPNPVVPHTGGPAGNALLTSWTGLVLLVLSLAELLTLFDVRGLISWHVALGALLVPPAVMKTASTGWRMTRYYTGSPTYARSGPPPMLLRLLGPLVVAATLGLLGTGIVLVLLGEERAHVGLLTLPGFRIDWVTLHQGFFIVWAAVTGLHLLGRIFPALQTTLLHRSGAEVPGRWARGMWFLVMAAGAAALAVALVHADNTWSGSSGSEQEGPTPAGARPVGP